MKMKINIEITNDDGKEIVKPVVLDTDIPEFDEFIDSNNFREVFNTYEKSVLKIRNMSAKIASEYYLSELSKKKLISNDLKLKILK